MDKFGAMPPLGLEWQIGKTAASIRFADAAEKFIAACPDKEASDRLKEAVRKVKSGELVMKKWTTPEEYLKEN